jgi:hypothetical protein
MSGESESDLSEENVDHLGSCFQEKVDPIYSFTSLLESDSDHDCGVFIVGQTDAPGDQAKQEVVKVHAIEIMISKKLKKDMEKAAGKKHMSP